MCENHVFRIETNDGKCNSHQSKFRQLSFVEYMINDTEMAAQFYYPMDYIETENL